MKYLLKVFLLLVLIFVIYSINRIEFEARDRRINELLERIHQIEQALDLKSEIMNAKMYDGDYSNVTMIETDGTNVAFRSGEKLTKYDGLAKVLGYKWKTGNNNLTFTDHWVKVKK